MSATEQSLQEAEVSAEQAAEEAADKFLFGAEPVAEGEEAGPVETEEADLSDEEEAAAEQVEEEHPELFEYTLGDETYEVPQALHEELQKAQDYTQKTQGVKREWETAQTKIAELTNLQSNYEFAESVREEQHQAVVLNYMINETNQYLQQQAATMTAQELTQTQLQIKQLETQRDAITSSLETKLKDHQQAQEQTKQELLNKSTDVLRQKIPNWGEDADKGLREYALSSGYTEAEYDALVDPRLKETLWKAAQYDRAKAGIEKGKKTIANKKITSSARKTMPKSTQNKLNLRKTMKAKGKSNADKAEALGEHISHRFGL